MEASLAGPLKQTAYRLWIGVFPDFPPAGRDFPRLNPLTENARAFAFLNLGICLPATAAPAPARPSAVASPLLKPS
jgi:hypothetical protein